MVTTLLLLLKNTLCVTGVYLRDITKMIFVILHLNVSQLSICSSCLGLVACYLVCHHLFLTLMGKCFSIKLFRPQHWEFWDITSINVKPCLMVVSLLSLLLNGPTTFGDLGLVSRSQQRQKCD